VTLRYSAAPGREDRLRSWLNSDLIPDLVLQKGFTSAFMLRSDRAPEMTAEQRIRGRDASVNLVLLVTGYSPELMAGLAQNELCASSFEAHGASPGTTSGVFQLAAYPALPRRIPVAAQIHRVSSWRRVLSRSNSMKTYDIKWRF
jgi:hypothetical protein